MNKKKLKKQIQRLCEKQYRKGYQHGYIARKDKLLSYSQVCEFRDKGSEQHYKKSINPENGRKIDPDLLVIESYMPDMDELIEILNS